MYIEGNLNILAERIAKKRGRGIVKVRNKTTNRIIAAHAAEANAQGKRAARQQCHRYSPLVKK